MRFFLMLLLSAVLADTVVAQRVSNWRVYRVPDGLPEPACASVTARPRGRVLVQHFNSQAISILDGYGVAVTNAPAPSRSRIYESPSGQLWTINREGLMEFYQGNWILHRIPEIAAQSRVNVTQDVPFSPIRHGRVIFLLPDRLMEFSTEDPENPRREVMREIDETRLGRFSGMTPARDAGLWISGDRGLAKIPGPIRAVKSENTWREFILPESLRVENLQEPYEDDNGGITCIGDEVSPGRPRVIVHFDGQNWSKIPVGSRRIRRAWQGRDGAFWAITIDSLLHFQNRRGDYIENPDITVRQFFDAAVEPGGTFWLATSDGLFHYIIPPWRTPSAARPLDVPIHGFAEDTAERLWFVAGRDLCWIDNDILRSYPIPVPPYRNALTDCSLMAVKDGSLLLETAGLLYQFQPATESFKAIPADRDDIRFRMIGRTKDGSVCVQSSAEASEPVQRALHLFDGESLAHFSESPPDEIASGRLFTLHVGQNNDVWFSGENGVAWYHDRKWQVFPISSRHISETILRFAELPEGKIWGAAQDKIWEFDGKNWSNVRVGFEYVNGMVRGQDGSIWVATDAGVLRFFQESWIENGIEEGLPGSAVRHLFEDQRGRLWAGTTHGLGMFPTYANDASVDQDPPVTSIVRSTEGELSLAEGGTLLVAMTALDKWKYTPTDRLLYSYRLDDGDWSVFSERNTIPLSDQPPGKHYFRVRAMDRNCNVTINTAQLVFVVTVPWYQETRSIFIAALGLAGALFFASVAFNRHRRLLRSYAEVEQKVADRTRELAIANRELLHSQKMTALGTLAAGIAHDFNNILSIIKGSAQIIEDNVDDPNKVRVRVDRIKTVVEQGSGIVQAMLGFSRSSDEQTPLCNVNRVVDDTIRLLGDRFLREVEIKFDAAPDVPEIPAAKDFIQQILLNFVFNADEAMTGRKQIVFSTRFSDCLPPELVLMPARSAKYVFISVKDFGSGIAPENLPRIFEPFFTTKALSTRRGTGLGLSMVYELARKMEAGLAVESELNKGSTFTLILPVRRTAPPESRKEHAHLS